MLSRAARVLYELWHLTMFDCLIHNDLAICKPARCPVDAGFFMFTRSNIEYSIYSVYRVFYIFLYLSICVYINLWKI